MSPRTVFLVLAGLAVGANVLIFILIMAALDRRGYKTSVLLSRAYTFKYLSAYKDLTERESGRPGRLHGLWILSIVLALAFALAALLAPR